MGARRLTGAVPAAAALLIGGAAAPPASAALIYDLRLTSGGGKVISALPGQTFQIDVFVVVDGNNNDGYVNGYDSILSNNAVADNSPDPGLR